VDILTLQSSLKQKNGLYIANHIIRLLSGLAPKNETTG
jgi:hypothetical protein